MSSWGAGKLVFPPNGLEGNKSHVGIVFIALWGDSHADHAFQSGYPLTYVPIQFSILNRFRAALLVPIFQKTIGA